MIGSGVICFFRAARACVLRVWHEITECGYKKSVVLRWHKNANFSRLQNIAFIQIRWPHINFRKSPTDIPKYSHLILGIIIRKNRIGAICWKPQWEKNRHVVFPISFKSHSKIRKFCQRREIGIGIIFHNSPWTDMYDAFAFDAKTGDVEHFSNFRGKSFGFPISDADENLNANFVCNTFC